MKYVGVSASKSAIMPGNSFFANTKVPPFQRIKFNLTIYFSTTERKVQVKKEKKHKFLNYLLFSEKQCSINAPKITLDV